MTQLENAIETVFSVFHQYSVHQPHPDKLSKGETKQLIEKELPEFMKKQVNPTATEQIFKDLDTSQGEEVSFEEFVVLVSRILTGTHQNVHHK